MKNIDVVREYQKKYNEENRERIIKLHNDWREKNKDRVLSCDKKRRELLRDSYIARTLGLRLSSIPTELLELKRQQLILKRELKKCNQSKL